MCQNVNPVTLSNKNDTVRVLNTLLVKTLKVVGCVTQKELSLHSFFFELSEQVFFQANVSRKTLPYDFIKRDSTTDVFRNMFFFIFFFGTAISQNSKEKLKNWKNTKLHVRKLYLFS